MRTIRFPSAVGALITLALSVTFVSASIAQEWEHRVKPRGILRVVDLAETESSIWLNYAEGLVNVDKDNNFVPCLAAGTLQALVFESPARRI